MASFFNLFKHYVQQRKIRQKFVKVYYYRLFKATALISIVPIIAVYILVVYERLTLGEGIFATCAVFFGSTFFAKPYLADLSALTYYVEQLALDRKVDAPPLSFLSNVGELSKSVKNLHSTWDKRKIQIESALAESSVLFDILPDILLMLDEHLTIIRANDTAYHVFGSDILHKSLKTITSDRTLNQRIQKVIQTGKGCVIEINVTHDDLKYDFRTSIKKFPIYSRGGIAAVLVLHDITETKRTKQMMKDFVANASHEIRTPLTSVIGFIEMLQTSAKDDPTAQKKFLDIMGQQAKHMALLVNDLLSLSKVEMKENTPPRYPLDLYGPISSAIKNIEWQASQRNMKLATAPK
jgi:two-component system, OmpR family, phosphate regulon sensor histidine kinase PhoR